MLHIHNIGETLPSKGVEFKDDRKVFEVCNSQQAAKMLSTDMRLNMALPCRILVFAENDKIKIGLIKLQEMLSALSDDETLAKMEQEVEEEAILMIDQSS